MLVLNAQMASVLQLSAYARASGDRSAGDTVREMLTATRGTLPAFDLGCWSRYSLGGNRATTHYHAYHVRLLRQLATLTGDGLYATFAERWNRGLQSGC